MIAIGIILLIIGTILLITAAWIEISEHDGSSGIGFLAGGLIVTGILLLCLNLDNTPTAMDVYQGKTTLQYTIVNSVKVDSVVVWKRMEE